MKKFSLLFVFCFLTCLFANAQSVGIGTNLPHPTAQLHVDVGSTSNGFLVSGLYNASTVPDLGGGSRMMFYPGKCAFRAGFAGSTQWNNANVGPFSVAFGYSTTAFGMESTAFGASTIANAQFSTAFGSGTLATGVASTAFGTATSASANSSTAMGSGTSAGGDYSTSMGYNTGAGGDYSVVAGNQSNTVGQSSMAMGSFVSAIGNYSFAQGYQAKARGVCSIAMGESGDSRGYASSTFGLSNISKGFSSTVVGMYNDSILNVDQSSSSSLTPLFIVGNGASSFARSNALVVRKDGHVGIGTNSPDFLLDVGGRMRIESDGGSNTAGLWLNKGDNSGLGAFIGMYNDSYVGLYGGLGGWDFVMNTSTGNVGIGTLSPSQKLSVAGNICYTGSIAACSDIRYKKNIRPISHALTNLLTLHGIYYNWNKEKFSDKGFTDDRQIGFSAQEIEKLFPEMVQTDAEGYKSVDYSRMTPVLVEAIKEQQTQIELLKRKIEKLEKNSHRKIIKH